MFSLHGSIAKLIIVQSQHLTDIEDRERQTHRPTRTETAHLLPSLILARAPRKPLS